MQPIQPIIVDEHGTTRFKKNELVQYLLDNGGLTINDLAKKEFSQEDRIQFAQLIGYSLSRFSELSYVTDEAYYAAQNMKEEGMTEEQAKIQYLEEQLANLRSVLKEPMAKLFRVHPDDLNDV